MAIAKRQSIHRWRPSFPRAGPKTPSRFGGEFLHVILRDKNAAPAEGIGFFLDDAVEKTKSLAKTVAIRADAAFVGTEILSQLDGIGMRFTIRFPDNRALQRLAAPYLSRPAGRPPKESYEFAVELAAYKNKK